MTKDERRLVAKALRKLEILDATDNQPLINEIQGILFELLSRTRN